MDGLHARLDAATSAGGIVGVTVARSQQVGAECADYQGTMWRSNLCSIVGERTSSAPSVRRQLAWGHRMNLLPIALASLVTLVLMAEPSDAAVWDPPGLKMCNTHSSERMKNKCLKFYACRRRNQKRPADLWPENCMSIWHDPD